MTCEKYEEALIEVAATGETPEGGFAKHLERCGHCQATLQREQGLFEAIDLSLRDRVNEMPRAGFLAGVRVQISKEPPPKSGWTPVWAWAGVAVALVLIAMAHPWNGLLKQEFGGNRTVPVIRAQRWPEIAQSEPRGSEGSDARGSARQSAAIRPVGKRFGRREPEVLVPPDEAKAFAQFVARVAGRDERAEAVVRPMMRDKVGNEDKKWLEMRPLDIADLQLETLESEWGSKMSEFSLK
jgi:hypothetical protein